MDNYRIQYAYFVDRENPDYKAPWNQLYNIPRVYTPEDKAIGAFCQVGDRRGLTFDVAKLSPEIRKAVEDGMADAWKEFAEFKSTMIDTGRVTRGDLFGTREFLRNNYLYRATAAVLGIYGNMKEEAMYLACHVYGADRN